MKIEKLKNRYYEICNEIVAEFCKKQEIDFDSWVGDRVGEIALIGDYYLNFSDILQDLNTNQEKWFIFQWYNDSVDNAIKNKFPIQINYQSYCMGLRYEKNKIMKNLYVLPTDNPSRLHLWTDKNGTRLETCELKYSHSRNKQNLYITNKEEIKDCFALTDLDKIVKVDRYNEELWHNHNCKKIILTTDLDLINDGVKAIDDTFIEWFLKNQNCEYVKIFNSKWVLGGEIKEFYKIIIPQEEPKKEIIKELNNPKFQNLKNKNMKKEKKVNYKVFKCGKKITTTSTYDTALYLAKKFECTVFSKKNGENLLMQTFEKPY